MSDITERIDLRRRQIQSNVLLWSNNKRRLHGLKPLRKNAKRKKRAEAARYLYDEIEKMLSEFVPEMIEKTFDNFTDVRSVEIGEPCNYQPGQQ